MMGVSTEGGDAPARASRRASGRVRRQLRHRPGAAGRQRARSRAAAGDIIVAKGNCGVPHYHDGQIHYDGTPGIMAAYVLPWRAMPAPG